jgi:RHH-type proline utilization regulon transcriptional repressor/proline dehydrogenase/delta 1-pyrroline-5-carboxylate dehydrogenase
MANRIDGDTPTNSLADWLTQLPQRLHGQGPQISFRDAPVVEAALELARMLQRRAMELQTPQEKRQQAELDRMIQHPGDKATLTQFTDQGFRSQSANRSVDQLVHILDVQGVPRFFGSIDWTLMKGFQSFGGYLPGVAVPLVKEKMRRETANVILPAEEAMLREHLKERRSEGVRMNVNFLGEAILGEKEAQGRLEGYLASLQLPEIECVSVKISTLYSQISALARRSTLRVLGERLEWLYRAALKETFQQKDGTKTTKFVYLDMEEYRDMWLTAELFMRTLDQPGLEQVRAGIALQAYLPDSFLVQEEITRWAMERRKRGGGPVTIRVVKGANMEMERVESSVRGWPQAPYKIKLETDANYKKIVQYGMEPARLDAVHLGIASHNLFDVAYALVLATQVQAGPRVQFEMLEGMANHQRRALFEATKRLLLYAPACHREEFINAIGYLIRRLDENTGPDNFLRHAFRITVDGSTWKRLEGGFLESLRMVDTISNQPRRTQDRRSAPCQPPPPVQWQQLENEPDTDFSLRQNSLWAEEIVARWEARRDAHATEIPVVIAGRQETGEGVLVESIDPSRPEGVAARYRQASEKQLGLAVQCASADPAGWRAASPEHRYGVLRAVAQQLRERRGDLMGAALVDGGKSLAESDPEVSEAIDFVEFYARCALDLFQDRSLGAQPRGAVLVVSPWNFPIAIPCGGIAAALAAGNTVLLKPASDTALPAFLLCEAFWAGGVPREALQLVPCSGRLAGSQLLGRPEIDTVILTGGTETAVKMLGDHPRLRLFAETGGKNGTIVTALSDRDQAIKNVLHSAFSHSGQKCSATSLLLLEDEVFHDRAFRDQLVDAVASLRVGSVWKLSTKMGPLIRPPEGALLRGLKELEHGESWALIPKNLDDNPCLYSPGIKWNVQRGSFTHLTELFGPVLGVMPFRKLEEAIELLHQTGYGLTSGLESLDDREQTEWRRRMRAGNLYINRPTTGAVVLRQPFGGLGRSAFGPGIKAGGPNYVVPLVRCHPPENVQLPPSSGPQLPSLKTLWNTLHRPSNAEAFVQLSGQNRQEWNRLLQAILDYDRVAREEIRQEHDTLRLLGQDNFRRYLPMQRVRLRVGPEDRLWEVLAAASAAVATGARITISRPVDLHDEWEAWMEQWTQDWGADIEFVEETDQVFLGALVGGQADRVRVLRPGSLALAILQTAIEQHVPVVDEPLHASGRIELLWYVQEQSVSTDYHRYGNLGVRATEARREPT